MAIDEKKAAELKAKHGDDLRVVEAADGSCFVFKRPSRQAYFRWVDTRENKPSEATLQIANDMIVFPDYGALIAALDKQPALLHGENGVLTAVLQLAGVGASPEVKKL